MNILLWFLGMNEIQKYHHRFSINCTFSLYMYIFTFIQCLGHAVCPRSLDQFCTVTFNIKWVKTYNSVPDPAADENADHEGEPVAEADAQKPAEI